MRPLIRNRDQLLEFVESGGYGFAIVSRPTYMTNAVLSKPIRCENDGVLGYTNKCGVVYIVMLMLAFGVIGSVGIFGVAAGGVAAGGDVLAACMLAAVPILYLLINLILRCFRRDLDIDLQQDSLSLTVSCLGVRLASSTVLLQDVVGYSVDVSIQNDKGSGVVIILYNRLNQFLGYMPHDVAGLVLEEKISKLVCLDKLLIVGDYHSGKVVLARNI